MIFSVTLFALDATVGCATLPSYASTRNGSSLLKTVATNVATFIFAPFNTPRSRLSSVQALPFYQEL
jgi:hypothetical protein